MGIISTHRLCKALGYAKAAGYSVIGAEAGNRSIPIGSEPPSAKTVLVVGNEGTGLGSSVAESCDFFVNIPGGAKDGLMGVDSLNVACTAGILLHHFLSKSGPN